MIINGDTLTKPIVREILNVVEHHVIVELKTGITQELEATAVVKDSSGAAVTSALPVGINRDYRFSADFGTGEKDYLLAKLTCNVSQYIIPLAVNSDCEVVFSVVYKEDAATVWSRDETFYFKPDDNIDAFSVIADETVALTPEELNEKFARVIRPGVIYGMKITHGTGTWMFNIDAGACMMPTGQRVEITSDTLNAFRIQPHNGGASHRIDAVTIKYAFGHEPTIEVVQGAYGASIPVVTDLDKAVIGFIRLDQDTDAPAKAGIAPNYSADFKRFNRLRRIFNEDLSAQANGVNKIFQLNKPLHEGSEDFRIDGVRKTTMYYDTQRFRNNDTGLGGAVIVKASQAAPGAGAVVTVDYDVANRPGIDPVEIEAFWTDAPPEYPWDDAVILLNNPYTTTDLSSGHVIGWDNSGTAAAANFVVNRFEPTLSPYAILEDGGVKFPRDGATNTNYVHGVLTYSSLVPQPSTLIFMAKYENDYPTGSLMTTDSIEPGPVTNFGVAIKHPIPNPAKVSMSLGGHIHEAESGAGLFDKQVYVLKIAANGDIHFRVNNHDYGVAAGSSFVGLSNLDEFYMINDLTATFYWLAFWQREVPTEEIDAVVEGLLSGHIV